MFSLKFTADTTRASKQLEVTAAVDEFAAQIMRPHMDSIVRLFKKASPKDTGELIRGWDSLLTKKPGEVSGKLVNKRPNAAKIFNFLRQGTRAHLIRPKKAKALAWQGHSGTIFARLVKHPGTKAVPSLGKPLTEGLAVIINAMKADIQKKVAERANAAR